MSVLFDYILPAHAADESPGEPEHDQNQDGGAEKRPRVQFRRSGGM